MRLQRFVERVLNGTALCAFEMHANVGLAGSTTGNTLRVVPQVESKIADVEPANTPLLTLLDKVKLVETIKGREYTMQEQWPRQWQTTVTVGTTASGTQITVDDGTFLTADRLIRLPKTNEQCLITNVNGNVLTIVRGATLGASLSSVITAGDTVMSIGPALREGQDKPTDVHRAPGMSSGFTQKFFSAAGITDVAQGLQYYGVDEYSRINTQMLIDFKKDQNRSLMFAMPMKYTAAGTFPRWGTGGLEWFCGLYNDFNMGGGVTWRSFDYVAQVVSRYGGPGSKWILCGPRPAGVFRGWAADMGIVVQDASKNELGFNITRINAGGSVFNIVQDWDLEGSDYDHMAFIIDNRYLKLKQSEAYKIEKNVQTPGAQREEWQMTRAFGLACTMPAAFARLRNIRYAS